MSKINNKKKLLVGTVIVFLTFVVSTFWVGFSLPFNQIKCGDSFYTLYNDIEGPKLMYNTQTNSKMFWKFTTVGKSIWYSEAKNQITTM